MLGQQYKVKKIAVGGTGVSLGSTNGFPLREEIWKILRECQWVPETTCGDLVTKWIEFLITREDSKTQSSDAKVSKMSLKIRSHAYKF